MQANGLLKFLTGAVAVGLVGLIGYEVVNQAEMPVDVAPTEEEASPLVQRIETGEDTPAAPVVDPETTLAIDETSESRLAVGVIGSVPDVNQVPFIEEIPWLESQANRAFNKNRDFACQLLKPDLPVKQPITRPQAGKRGALGRIPVVTIGLEVDEDSRRQLPTASRGAIHGYLANHRLAIEPIVYQSEAGLPYFGADCRAAFYETQNPTVTVESEPMIAEAVGNFRALGVLREGEQTSGRTLVMAFRYTQQASQMITKSTVAGDVTELLFLHLAQTEPGNLPRLEVFATSESRQSLHQLVLSSTLTEDPLPTIAATIRFEKFVLMGLYPADPIVTGFRQRAIGVMSLETILRLTNAATKEDRLTFEQVLDRFSSIVSGQGSAASPSTSTSATAK